MMLSLKVILMGTKLLTSDQSLSLEKGMQSLEILVRLSCKNSTIKICVLGERDMKIREANQNHS